MKMEELDENKNSKKKEVVIPKLNELVEEVSKVDDKSHWLVEGLPSKYKLYPKGTEIKARPLGVLEVKMLSSINEKNVNHVINEVLRRTVVGIPIEDLLVADKLFIIFWLRANTYKNSGYSIDYDCNECKAKNKYELELDNLDITEIKDSFDPNKSVELPESCDKIKIKILSIADENVVPKFLERNKDSLSLFDEDILNVANMISSVNGEPTGLLSKYQYLTELNPADYAYIESYILHCDFGVKPVVETECVKCGGTALVAVTFRPDFFVPKYNFD